MLTISAGLRGRVSLGVNHEYCLCHGTEGHGHVAETVGEGALREGGSPGSGAGVALQQWNTGAICSSMFPWEVLVCS